MVEGKSKILKEDDIDGPGGLREEWYAECVD